jgi:hypothetical protein
MAQRNLIWVESEHWIVAPIADVQGKTDDASKWRSRRRGRGILKKFLDSANLDDLSRFWRWCAVSIRRYVRIPAPGAEARLRASAGTHSPTGFALTPTVVEITIPSKLGTMFNFRGWQNQS